MKPHEQEFINYLKEHVPDFFHTAILEDGIVKPAHIGEAIVWQINNKEKMAVDKTKVRQFEISTVFYIIDFNGNSTHQHFDTSGVPARQLRELEEFARTSDRPICHFETMIFGTNQSEAFDRYQTLKQAKAGHERACQKMENRLEKEHV